MRIGLIVDGQAEFRSLPTLIRRIDTSHVLLDPLFADIQPFAPLAQVVGEVRSKLPILQNRRIDHLIVLLDRESRPDCPGFMAKEIAEGIVRACAARLPETSFSCVVKNSRFENWLISDLEALGRMNGRFMLSAAQRRAISPDRADNIDALAILKAAALDKPYAKVRDAMRIMERAQPRNLARNSRSFRRFLRLVGDPDYAEQSKRSK